MLSSSVSSYSSATMPGMQSLDTDAVSIAEDDDDEEEDRDTRHSLRDNNNNNNEAACMHALASNTAQSRQTSTLHSPSQLHSPSSCSDAPSPSSSPSVVSSDDQLSSHLRIGDQRRKIITIGKPNSDHTELVPAILSVSSAAQERKQRDEGDGNEIVTTGLGDREDGHDSADLVASLGRPLSGKWRPDQRSSQHSAQIAAAALGKPDSP